MQITVFLNPSELPHRSQAKPDFDKNMGYYYRRLPDYNGELNVFGQRVSERAEFADAKAAAAEASAQIAEAAKVAAIAAVGAPAWVSGTTYAKNAQAISQVNFQPYRRMVAGSGTVDPANDTAAVWMPLFGNGAFTPRAAAAATFDLSSTNYFIRAMSATETWVFDKCPTNGFSFAVELVYTGGTLGLPTTVKTTNNVVYSFIPNKTYLLLFITSNKGSRWRMSVTEPYDN